MARDPTPYWLQDMSPYRRGPSTAGTLILFAILAIVLLALLYQPTTATAEGGHVAPPTTAVPACAQHFPPTCKRR